MASLLDLFPARGAAEARPELATGEKRVRWFELCLVLLVAFSGSIFNALYIWWYGPGVAGRPTNAHFASGMIHAVVALLLLGYVLHRSGRRFKDIGFNWSLKDVGVGLILLAVSIAVNRAGFNSIYRIHLAIFGTPPLGYHSRDFYSNPGVLMIPDSFLNPFYEELIVRAYLMTEVEALTGSMDLAVLLSVGVQFSYHLYYGFWTALAMCFHFMVMSLYFARWRRALPLVVAHGFFDIAPLFRLF
jgi:Type II CAAX prenyl endopeptidase Rce1-like